MMHTILAWLPIWTAVAAPATPSDTLEYGPIVCRAHNTIDGTHHVLPLVQFLQDGSVRFIDETRLIPEIELVQIAERSRYHQFYFQDYPSGTAQVVGGTRFAGTSGSLYPGIRLRMEQGIDEGRYFVLANRSRLYPRRVPPALDAVTAGRMAFRLSELVGRPNFSETEFVDLGTWAYQMPNQDFAVHPVRFVTRDNKEYWVIVEDHPEQLGRFRPQFIFPREGPPAEMGSIELLAVADLDGNGGPDILFETQLTGMLSYHLFRRTDGGWHDEGEGRYSLAVPTFDRRIRND